MHVVCPPLKKGGRADDVNSHFLVRYPVKRVRPYRDNKQDNKTKLHLIISENTSTNV